MSVNMIIILVLALLVLIVSIVMYIRQKDKAVDVLNSCVALGGDCDHPNGDKKCQDGYKYYPAGTCDPESVTCCIKA